jgi:hypothetical protein
MDRPRSVRDGGEREVQRKHVGSQLLRLAGGPIDHAQRHPSRLRVEEDLGLGLATQAHGRAAYRRSVGSRLLTVLTSSSGRPGGRRSQPDRRSRRGRRWGRGHRRPQGRERESDERRSTGGAPQRSRRVSAVEHGRGSRVPSPRRYSSSTNGPTTARADARSGWNGPPQRVPFVRGIDGPSLRGSTSLERGPPRALVALGSLQITTLTSRGGQSGRHHLLASGPDR